MEKYLALKASAGSGKTFALTVRYISLLLLGAKSEEILTLTFTNKASNEMSERIYKTLYSLGEDEAYLNEIIKVTQLSEDEILNKKEYILKDFQDSNLAIYTIDKFVNKILREFCGYIGVSDDFEIQSDDEELLSYKFLQTLDEENFLDLVDFASYESKKFASLFELFKILNEKNESFSLAKFDNSLIDLQKDLILKIAFKIKEHFLSCTAASNSAKNAVNFDSFEELFSKTWIEKERLASYSYFKKCSNDEVESIFLALKDEFLKYYKLRAGYSLSKILNLFKSFKDFKFDYNLKKNQFEFSDISNLVYTLLSTNISKEFLYFRLDSTYNHILIDEFQDTSILQYKILKPLIEEILAADSTKFKTFFYVGDPKQSIYRFRGGKRELFDYVIENNSLIKVENLNINYRSRKNIIDFVNSKFSNLANYEYINQESLEANSGGYVEVIEDEDFTNDKNLDALALKVKDLIDSGIKPDDIAILTYTNSDVLDVFYFLKEKFPLLNIRTELNSKLINQQNVKALINGVKYLYFKENIYKENFNALLGIDFNSSFEIKLDEKDFVKEFDMSKFLYSFAKTFEMIDDNIIRLIEISSRYRNIVDFIYEIDKLEESLESPKTNGLQILTVFKSKGLEFHTVILMDRLTRKNYDKSSLLFNYNGIELQNIYYKIKGFESFDDEYKQALEKEKNLSLDDEKNILYVALTRAKNNLIVFKKTKSSSFELLNLRVEKIGEIIKSNKQVFVEEIKKVEYKALNLGKQEQAIKQEKIYDKEFLRAKYFGLATHFVLELMQDFSKEELDELINISKTKYLNFLSQDDFIDIKNRVEQLIRDDKFKNLIKDASFTNEQALVFNEEIKIIDLLIFKENSYYIVDFKTTAQIQNSHKTQVLHYKKAISEIFNTNKVEAILIYLQKDKIELVEL